MKPDEHDARLPLWAKLRLSHGFAEGEERARLHAALAPAPPISPSSAQTMEGCDPGTSCLFACLQSAKDGCESSCQDSCEASCQDACKSSCQTGCEASCQTGCETSCQDSCESSCQGTCLSACQEGCMATCQISQLSGSDPGQTDTPQ